MLRLPKLFTSKLSFRISLKVVSLVAALLAVALITMLLYSRKTVKQEAIMTAEQTLEGTMEHIDGILLSVEQSAGNIYFNMCRHLDDPEMMLDLGGIAKGYIADKIALFLREKGEKE